MRPLKLISYAVVGSLAVLVGVSWYASGQLTAPAAAQIGEPPSWLDAKVIRFSSDSGSTIHGWLAAAAEPRAAIVLLHPVRGNRRSMLGRARFLTDSGLSVLLIDLQAHGESGGDQITFGHLESLDAAAAVSYMRDSTPDVPLLVLGASLGGAAALLADPRLPVDGLIVEAVYPTVEIAVRNRLRIRMGRFGELFAPMLLAQLKPRLGVDPIELRPVESVGRINAPVFVVAGDADRRTTVDDTRMLYDSLVGSKQLWLIPGAVHQDFHALAGIEYETRLLRFINDIVSNAT